MKIIERRREVGHHQGPTRTRSRSTEAASWPSARSPTSRSTGTTRRSKTRDDETFEYANEVYGDYLALFPDNPKSYDLRFFWAELLNDNLRKYDEGRSSSTPLVVVQDGKAIDAKQKPGKWLPNAAFNAVSPTTRW